MDQSQAILQVDRFVHERRVTDRKLVSWPLYFFLLSWITLGIYSLYVFYLRICRADGFRNRKRHYYLAVVDATRQEVSARGSDLEEATRQDLDDLQRFVKERFTDEHRPLQPGLSVFLSIITLGVYGLYAVYRMMKFWWEIQTTEQDFDEKLSLIWLKAELIKYPITYVPDEELHRSFGLHLVLTIVTFGIYGIFWDYRLHTDPDRVFPEFHTAEDAVLAVFRSP